MLTACRAVRILGVPMDMGQRRRGVDMGPSALRYAGLQEHLRRLGYAVHDCGNLDVPVVEEVTERESSARYVEAVAEVCNRVYQEILACVAEDDFAIVLGGDHSISIGSIAAMARRRPTGVIWVDAHGDFNTPETSPSGNVHGMPVAALIGQGAPSLVNVGYAGAKLQPSQIVMIGVRDLDPEERVRLAESHISVFTMAEIDEHGIAEVTRRALDRLNFMDALHVSLDMDALDPEDAPGVGTPVRGGISYREAHLLMEILARSGKVRSMDIVEINPILDQRNQTAETAVALAASLLGKRIL
ncbi:MAG: arginase [Chloroflexi bacterium]|nr:arginase [Chloroflexota bacterium]